MTIQYTNTIYWTVALFPGDLSHTTSFICLGLYQNTLGASQVAPVVKNPLINAGDPVGFLGWEDPLEKGQATHSRILA